MNGNLFYVDQRGLLKSYLNQLNFFLSLSAVIVFDISISFLRNPDTLRLGTPVSVMGQGRSPSVMEGAKLGKLWVIGRCNLSNHPTF